MKKVLLATTALVLSAGVASAEISMSGSARMGLVYSGNVAGSAAVAGSITAEEITAVVGEEGAQAANLLLTDLFGASVEGVYAVTSEGMAEALGYRAELAAGVASMEAAHDAAQDGDEVLAAAIADAKAELALVDAGIAAASGSAAVAPTDSSIVFDNRMTVNIDASTETTSGLTFGGKLRIRSNDGNNASVNGARVYMKSGAVEVAVGNIWGALDSMPGMYNSEVGLTALSDAGVVANVADSARAWGYDGYASTGSQMGVELMYSAGALSAHVSMTDSSMGSASDRVAAVAAYTMGDWTVAAGMQESDNHNEDKTVVTVGGKVGDFGVGFAAADNDGVTKIAVNGSATMGATTLSGFIADDESGTDTALGLGVSHDLGGAALVAGVERDATGMNRADMGVSFSF